jgi:hypothetical protein
LPRLSIRHDTQTKAILREFNGYTSAIGCIEGQYHPDIQSRPIIIPQITWLPQNGTSP